MGKSGMSGTASARKSGAASMGKSGMSGTASARKSGAASMGKSGMSGTASARKSGMSGAASAGKSRKERDCVGRDCVGQEEQDERGCVGAVEPTTEELPMERSLVGADGATDSAVATAETERDHGDANAADSMESGLGEPKGPKVGVSAAIPEPRHRLVPYDDSSESESEEEEDSTKVGSDTERPVSVSPSVSQTSSATSIPHQLPNWDPRGYYEVKFRQPIVFKGGQVTQQAFTVRIIKEIEDDDEHSIDRLQRLHALLHHAFFTVFAHAPRDTIGQVFMENKAMHTQYQPTRRCRIDDITFDDIADQLNAAEQSTKNGSEEEKVRMEDTEFTLVTYEPKKQVKVGGVPTGLMARNEANIYTYVQRSRAFVDPMAKSYRIPASLSSMCVPFCILLGVKRHRLGCQPSGVEDPMRGEKLVEFMRYGRSPQLRSDAEDLVAQAGLQPSTGPFTIQQIGEIQRLVLGDDYQVNVFETNAPPLHSFGDDLAPIHINLLVRHDLTKSPKPGHAHAVLIVNMNAFMGKNHQYCRTCKKSHHKTTVHRCSRRTCRQCRNQACTNVENHKIIRPYKTCIDCNFTYLTRLCYEAHKKEEVCLKRARCPLCRKTMVVKKKKKKVESEPDEAVFKEHKCGQILCSVCRKFHLPQQWCHVRPVAGKVSVQHPENAKTTQYKSKPPANDSESMDKEAEEVKEEEEEEEEEGEEPGLSVSEVDSVGLEVLLGSKKIWYADSESMADEETGEHTANLLVLQRPRHDKGPEEYDQRVYRGPNAMRRFVEDCMQKGSEYKGCTIVFHNAAGFDAHLWQRELLLLDCPPKRPIYKGQKILTFTMQQNQVKVLDSLQFVPGTALAKFPALFNLSSGPKGEFPHQLNSRAWVDFDSDPDKVYEEKDPETGAVHSFPPLSYFHPENKSEKARAKLEEWHSEQVQRFSKDSSLQYKPARELELYCEQDVRILREGCEIMRANWLQQFPDMELFDYLTFPSFNNALFRTKYMPKDSIVLLPPEGFYRRNRKYSMQSLCKGFTFTVKQTNRHRNGFEAGCPWSGLRSSEKATPSWSFDMPDAATRCPLLAIL
jgi:hypothetical protein